MEFEKYAAPRRRRVLTWVGGGLAPALVLCVAVSAVGQLHRFYDAWQGGFFQGGGGQVTAPPPLSLRIGIMLSDPSATAPALVPALAVLALTGLVLARVRTAPVTGRVRRAGVAAAALVGVLGAALAVVVVGWVLTTHGSVGGNGGSTDTIDASLQLDPWDTLAGQGAMGLFTAVIGAGAALLLATGAPAAPGAPGAAAPRGDTDARGEAAGSPGTAGGDATAPGVNGSPPSAPSAPPARDLVVVASPPTVDLTAFKRPESPASGASSAPATREPPAAADGYRRPTGRSGAST